MFNEKTKISDSFKMSGIKKAEEGLKICGKVRLIGHNKDGSLAFDREYPNLITYAGFNLVMDCLGLNDQPSDITHMAIGHGAVGNISATTLTNEDKRSTAAYAHTPGAMTCTFTGIFTTVSAATEYGLFNDSSVGSMLNTAGFAAITIDSLTIIATLTLSSV